MIREAKISDASQLYAMEPDIVYNGFESLGMAVDIDSLVYAIMRDIKEESSIVIVAEISKILKGIMVAHLRYNYFNMHQKIGSIIMWNVTEDARKTLVPCRMFREMVRMCRDAGCAMVDAAFTLGHSPGSLAKVYRKLGMTEVETLYRMEV